MKWNPETYRITDRGRLGRVALGIGLVSLAASAAGLVIDPQQFYFSYLVAFYFWLSIGLGGLFFTLLHHLVNAEWSTVWRRWAESAAGTLPLLAIFVLPILFGMGELYHWSHADAVATDKILQGKAAYLNPTFFTIRSLGYFAIWSVLAILLKRESLRQDEKHSEALLLKLKKISAPGMILFAVTTTFASFDWLMSLNAHWYSTIFGLYLFSGSVVAILSFVVLIGLHQRRQSVLKEQVTIEHYHDMGKLIFGFVVFWAYMGFSQYLLMWYANIPEETVWYYVRWYNDWRWVSLVLIFGHFALPFLVLITRASKRYLPVLGGSALWMLAMRWFDLHWLAMPNLHEHGPHLSWLDFTTLAGIGGIFVWYFWRQYTSHPIVPVGDPTLANSIEFENN